MTAFILKRLEDLGVSHEDDTYADGSPATYLFSWRTARRTAYLSCCRSFCRPVEFPPVSGWPGCEPLHGVR